VSGDERNEAQMDKDVMAHAMDGTSETREGCRGVFIKGPGRV
jgi:hypothetical protein